MTLSAIQTSRNTCLSGSEPGLVSLRGYVDGVPAGNNTAISTVIDITGNGADGRLSNFILSGSTSNFVCADTTFIIGGCCFNVTALCSGGENLNLE